MAVGDFWRRVAHEPVGATGGEGTGRPSIATALFQSATTLAGIGGPVAVTKQQAAAMMQLLDGDEMQEWSDFYDTGLIVVPGQPDLTRARRHQFADGAASIAFIAVQIDVPSNIYGPRNGELVRRAVRDLSIEMGVTPIGTLAAADR